MLYVAIKNIQIVSGKKNNLALPVNKSEEYATKNNDEIPANGCITVGPTAPRIKRKQPILF